MFGSSYCFLHGRDNDWIAEHMLILEVEDPAGKKTYVAAISKCVVKQTWPCWLLLTLKGWKVSTVGDDIAWLKPDEEGMLGALNWIFGSF